MFDYLTMGLDFGTHQTKVCVENARDSRNITYSFFEFTTPEGGRSLFLPSIVQLNNDNTLSYGFTDESTAKSLGYVYLAEEPVRKIVKPREVTPLPIKSKEKEAISKGAFIKQEVDKLYAKTKNPLNKSFELLNQIQKDILLRSYFTYKDRIEKENRDNAREYERKVRKVLEENKQEQIRIEKETEEAERQFILDKEKWENSKTEIKAIYRYFKIASYSKEYEWREDIPAKMLSIWYMTYLLFLLREKYQPMPYIQLGIPSSASNLSLSEWQRTNATDIFYCAWDLMMRIGSLNTFLSTKVEKLKKLTKTYGCKKEDYFNAPYILVLPEAFASLESITLKGKLRRSTFHLLLDIGGGSTDVSLFYVTDKGKPNISSILSVHKGLNYIFKMYQKDHTELRLDQVKDRFREFPDEFDDYINVYQKEIASAIQDKIVLPLMNASTDAGIGPIRIKEALRNRPVVYTGGGGIYEAFHYGIHYFQDPLSVSEDLLTVNNIKTPNVSNEELSILTVAYGLSIPQRREPKMTSIKELFDENEQEREVQGYIHGLSDVE